MEPNLGRRDPFFRLTHAAFAKRHFRRLRNALLTDDRPSRTRVRVPPGVPLSWAPGRVDNRY
jgi:hypothetical protein